MYLRISLGVGIFVTLFYVNLYFTPRIEYIVIYFYGFTNSRGGWLGNEDGGRSVKGHCFNLLEHMWC